MTTKSFSDVNKTDVENSLKMLIATTAALISLLLVSSQGRSKHPETSHDNFSGADNDDLIPDTQPEIIQRQVDKIKEGVEAIKDETEIHEILNAKIDQIKLESIDPISDRKEHANEEQKIKTHKENLTAKRKTTVGDKIKEAGEDIKTETEIPDISNDKRDQIKLETIENISDLKEHANEELTIKTQEDNSGIEKNLTSKTKNTVGDIKYEKQVTKTRIAESNETREELSKNKNLDVTTNESAAGTIPETKVTVIDDAWSDDGLIHCVETSDNTITCHRYDEPHNHANVPSDAGLDWYIGKYGKTKPKTDNDDQTRKELPNVDNSTNDTFRRIVKLDLSGNDINVIDSISGKRKHISMLLGDEEVDIDSLTSAQMMPKKPILADSIESLTSAQMMPKKPVLADSIESLTSEQMMQKKPIFADIIETLTSEQMMLKKRILADSIESLQDILNDMEKLNFTRLHIDTEYTTSNEIWKNDFKCEKFRTRFGRQVAGSTLACTAGSGCHWLRYLLEASTGILTGGVGEPKPKRSISINTTNQVYRTLTVLSHKPPTGPSNNDSSTNHLRQQIPTVLLMRQPQGVILSLWLQKMRLKGHKSVAKLTADTDKKEFHDFITKELNKWEKTQTGFLLWSRHIHVVHYEDLLRRPLVTLMRVLRFLNVPPPTKDRLRCVKKFVRQTGIEEEWDQDPFTSSESDAFWSSSTRVSGLLHLRDMPLPPYHVDIRDYPPDRLYKVFTDNGQRKGASSRSTRKDEL